MFSGFSGNYAILISPALGQRLLCCPKRGTYVPPFFCVWEGRTYGPCNPLRAVELCSTPRKFFEKNLTKNFYLPPPNFCGGTRPYGTQESGLSRAATRQKGDNLIV